jgi:hypothetical protein
VLRIDAGSKNTIGRLISRDNSTVDPRIMRALVEFRADAASNFIGLFKHRRSRRSPRRAYWVVRGDRGSSGNVIAHGEPWRQLQRHTRDNGRNSFFSRAVRRSSRRLQTNWIRHR